MTAYAPPVSPEGFDPSAFQRRVLESIESEGPTMKVDVVLKLGDRKFAQALDQEVDADDSLRLDAPVSREELRKAADDDGNVRVTVVVRKGER